jgi:uncharacterized membrane protein
MQTISLYLQAGFYILAGLNHFRMPRFYMKMMPEYLPAHKFLVDWSGIAEVLLGIGLLIPQTRVISAWGIIALLIAVFPANLYMLTSGKFTKMPQWILWMRFPLQILMILWAYSFTK